MIITSPSFTDGGMIPRKFTGDGGNMNPELQIQNVPPEAQSLALILHDPDAPRAGGFCHWLVWNIDPQTLFIKEESTPPGAAEGTNDAGWVGYVGPQPPSGTHHYRFTIHALDVPVLGLSEGTSMEGLVQAMKGHIVATAELVGLYGGI